jgi:hypothetical protein
MAGLIAKLSFLSAEHSDKLMSWGSTRFRDFRITDTPYPATGDETPSCLVGGLFREPPRSLQHLQRLVNNNLKNWGVPRRSYEHGWLRLASRDEARERLGLKAEAEQECEQIVRQIVGVEMWKEVDANAAERQAKRNARREKACELRGYVSYSQAELKECSGWAAVKRRRMSEPADPRRDRYDLLCSREALERAAQSAEPVGL